MIIFVVVILVFLALIHLYSILTPDFDGIRGSSDNAYIKNGVYSLSELSMFKFLGVRKHLTSLTYLFYSTDGWKCCFEFLSFSMTILFDCTF